MQVALHGSYYAENFGDVLLLALFNKWIRQAVPGCRVALPAALPEIRTHVGADPIGPTAGLLSSDVLIFGGGGYFGEPPEGARNWALHFIRRHGSVGLAFAARRRPFAIIGVGAGPLSNAVARMVALRLFKRADVVAVRDEESKSYLVDYGVDENEIAITADAALTLTVDDIPGEAFEYVDRLVEPAPASRWIGVHLSGSAAHERSLAVLREGIIEYSRRYPEIGVVLLADSKGQDQRSNIEILSKALHCPCVMAPYVNPWIVSALLARIDLVITTKLHVGIVASALGKPVLSFPKHWKTPRFFRQLGASERCLPLVDVASDAVSYMFDRYWTDHARVNIPEALREAASRNRALLVEFLRSA